MADPRPVLDERRVVLALFLMLEAYEENEDLTHLELVEACDALRHGAGAALAGTERARVLRWLNKDTPREGTERQRHG